MIYVLNKENFKFIGRFDNMKFAKEMLNKEGILEDECIFTEDIGMKYVSRIVEVDGKVIYMNKDWWSKEAPSIIKDYENHKVYDFIEVSKPENERKPVSLDRFKRELYQNIDRINAIDGVAGEVDYNISVGSDFIALFREMCVITLFEEITPLQIAEKTANIIPLILTGSFKEAIVLIQHLDVDEFLTQERLNLFINMLKSADSIDYMS